MKLKGGSNERPCHFVKRLEVMESSPALTNYEKRGGAVSDTGLGPATELEMELSQASS